MTGNVQHLRSEVDRLKAQLAIAQQHRESRLEYQLEIRCINKKLELSINVVLWACMADTEKMSHFALEERHIRDENLRLQRRLQLEMERREALCRHLSESESSLEMEDERHFHESLLTQAGGSSSNQVYGGGGGQLSHSVSAMGGHGNTVSSGPLAARPRPTSSPGPFVPSPGSRPLSPGE